MRNVQALVLRTALAVTVTASILGAGCSTRESKPTATADSTWVYPSKIPGDVVAGIAFSQKGGTQPLEVRQHEARKKSAQTASKKKAVTSGKRSGTKSSAAKKSAKKSVAAKEPTAEKASTAKKSSKARKSSSAKTEKPSAPFEPRAFDIQEGARVVATITLENQRSRGERPLVLHMVWLKPNMRTAYKKMIEYDPFGSESTLTSAFSITPDKRAPGIYTFRVYLHRELIAEKTFELRGSGLEEKDDDGGGI